MRCFPYRKRPQIPARCDLVRCHISSCPCCDYTTWAEPARLTTFVLFPILSWEGGRGQQSIQLIQLKPRSIMRGSEDKGSSRYARSRISAAEGTMIWQTGSAQAWFTRNKPQSKVVQWIRQGVLQRLWWHSEKTHSQTPQRLHAQTWSLTDASLQELIDYKMMASFLWHVK